ncbi:MAG: glycosyltransferase [Planctomycetes bacterium]|nr:glycosyltransferase [Planctomycetota bacterium]
MTNSDTKTSPRLSVAMIVRDAGELLAASLDSIRGIADEVVVTDTGSMDNSVAIARRGADAVHQIAWQESFAAARNECLGQVTGDWVLWLDAGETIDDMAAQQLRRFLDEAADENKSYMLLVQRPVVNATHYWEQIGQTRLLPNRPGLRFSGRVRETTIASVLTAGMGIDTLDCVIRRGPWDCDLTTRKNRAMRNLRLGNLALHEAPVQPQTLLARAEALGQLGQWSQSTEAHRHALAATVPGSSEMLEAYYGLLTSMDAEPKAAEMQISTCLEAMEIFPLDAQLLCGMGSYLLGQGRLDLAARSYETAVHYGKVEPTIWHLADLGEVAVVCLSLVTQLGGNTKRAEQLIHDALDEQPDSPRLRRQMIEICVKGGRQQEALAHCRLLPRETPYLAELPTVVQGAALAASKNSGAAIPVLKSTYEAGCRDTLCLRWLAAAHLAEGDFAEVEAIISEWGRLEPGNLEIVAFRQAVAERRGNRKNDVNSGNKGRNAHGGTAGSPSCAQQLRVDGRSAGPIRGETPPYSSRPTPPGF